MKAALMSNALFIKERRKQATKTLLHNWKHRRLYAHLSDEDSRAHVGV
jgi:hypothetical protein